MAATAEAFRAPYALWLFVVRYCNSKSFTLHLSFSTLFALVIIALCIIYNAVRSRYLKNYSKLPIETQRKEPAYEADVFTDHTDPDLKSGLHNYLDEFLSAIKVFGYLERPVFHELTRHLQTRKLLAGETLNLEDEKSFCLVVDGHIQVFFKTEGSSKSDDEYEENGEGYRLLTDVRNGIYLHASCHITLTLQGIYK